MKTHEFASYLETIAKMLRTFPDRELDNSIIESIAKPAKSNSSSKKSRNVDNQLKPGIEEELLKKSPAEVEGYLASEKSSFTIAQLYELSERLGIQASKRQSKQALVNLITRHFEAKQMHTIIRSAKHEAE